MNKGCINKYRVAVNVTMDALSLNIYPTVGAMGEHIGYTIVLHSSAIAKKNSITHLLRYIYISLSYWAGKL